MRKRKGNAIERAECINQFKIDHGINPVWPYHCKDDEEE